MQVRSGQTVTVTVHTRVGSQLQNLADLVCAVSVNGVRGSTPTVVVNVSAGEYRVSFVIPGTVRGSIVELIASTLLQLDAEVIWRGITTSDGGVLVDHNTGGVDALSIRNPDNTGLPGVEILAFRKAEYDAGIYEERDKSITNVLGRWVTPMSLTPDVEYVLLIRKTGIISPYTVSITPTLTESIFVGSSSILFTAIGAGAS